MKWVMLLAMIILCYSFLKKMDYYLKVKISLDDKVYSYVSGLSGYWASKSSWIEIFSLSDNRGEGELISP